MKRPDLPMTGACRCGRTSIRIVAAPFMTAACHCSGCQKMSASAYSLTAMIAPDAMEVIEGDTVIGGLKTPGQEHHFCPHCFSWMFTRITMGGNSFLNLRPTMLDDASWFEPFIETMTAERLPWATTPARHSYQGFPDMSDFPALMAGFAAAQV